VQSVGALVFGKKLFVPMWAAGLFLACVVAGFAGATIVDWDFEHEMTYCALISKRPIYRHERLEHFCALKVRKHGNEVISFTLKSRVCHFVKFC
jgi:hypothetical protein